MESSKAVGKKNVTQKDIDCHNRGKEQRVNYKVYGPKLLALLKAIYECPIHDKAALGVSISDAGDLLMEIQDRYGEMED